jgi:hypothetical protein
LHVGRRFFVQQLAVPQSLSSTSTVKHIPGVRLTVLVNPLPSCTSQLLSLAAAARDLGVGGVQDDRQIVVTPPPAAHPQRVFFSLFSEILQTRKPIPTLSRQLCKSTAPT